MSLIWLGFWQTLKFDLKFPIIRTEKSTSGNSTGQCDRHSTVSNKTIFKTNSTVGKRKKSNGEQQVHRQTQKVKPVQDPASTPLTTGGGELAEWSICRGKIRRQWMENAKLIRTKEKNTIIVDPLEVVLLLLVHSLGGVWPACRPLAFVLQYHDEMPAEAASTLLILEFWHFLPRCAKKKMKKTKKAKKNYWLLHPST